ncbi:hypothetical protein LTS15_007089 [Exophiala xenobiotica]|nr:hypothetical protein LTS15_007089 [Exophiala xenobiotica]
MLGFQVKHLDTAMVMKSINDWHEANEKGLLSKLKTDDKTYSKFRKTARPLRESDGLGPYKLQRPPLKSIVLSEEERKKLAADLEVNTDVWIKDGSIVLDCMNWWETHQYLDGKKVSYKTIAAVADAELEMYRHHLRKINGKENFGWLRNMFHSLNQQVMRQDPLYYLYYCALREWVVVVLERLNAQLVRQKSSSARMRHHSRALSWNSTTVMHEGTELIVRKNDSLAVHGDSVVDFHLSSFLPPKLIPRVALVAEFARSNGCEDKLD